MSTQACPLASFGSMAPKPRQLDLFGRALPDDWVPTLPVEEPDSDESYDDWPAIRKDMDEQAEVCL